MEGKAVAQMLVSVKVVQDLGRVQSYLKMPPAAAVTYRSMSIGSQMFHQALVEDVPSSYARRLCMYPLYD